MKNPVNKKRANIDRLIKTAMTEASIRQKQIDTIDPLVICARRLFPYLHEETIYEYGRTALRVIKNRCSTQTVLNDHQTTLTVHFANH